jgi:phosphoribosylcarboxyaminoimidazole (NCAIR) mutase
MGRLETAGTAVFVQWRFLSPTLLLCAWLLVTPQLGGVWQVQLLLEAFMLLTALVTVWANPQWRRLRSVLIALWLFSVSGTILSIELTGRASWRWFRTLELLSTVPMVAILAAGSSDLAVASEAHLALACHGVASDLILDVGVAGLHRLLTRLDDLVRYRVLIVCAGMEGALPTVVAGLLPQPVIGVPVSVGYGVSKGGRAALQGMLASCAPGLTVVNIDNGYGAAMAALRILQAPRGDGG